MRIAMIQNKHCIILHPSIGGHLVVGIFIGYLFFLLCCSYIFSLDLFGYEQNKNKEFMRKFLLRTSCRIRIRSLWEIFSYGCLALHTNICSSHARSSEIRKGWGLGLYGLHITDRLMGCMWKFRLWPCTFQTWNGSLMFWMEDSFQVKKLKKKKKKFNQILLRPSQWRLNTDEISLGELGSSEIWGTVKYDWELILAFSGPCRIDSCSEEMVALNEVQRARLLAWNWLHKNIVKWASEKDY